MSDTRACQKREHVVWGALAHCWSQTLGVSHVPEPNDHAATTVMDTAGPTCTNSGVVPMGVRGLGLEEETLCEPDLVLLHIGASSNGKRVCQYNRSTIPGRDEWRLLLLPPC